MKSAVDLQLAGLIHDLNNVLQTLGAAADQLSTDPQWQPLAESMFRTVQRGQRITASLRETDQTCPLAEVLALAQAFTLDWNQQRRPLHFAFDVAPDLRVRGHAASLERVFVNLFLNSVRWMPHGGTIAARAWRQDARTRIEVLDDGLGIAPGALPFVFDAGFTQHPDGSGMGLHIVRSLVEAHGGTVTIANRTDNTGTRVTIELPEAP
jgi:signal transduction histidine kinase